ncbi:MBL fold metallo-hydrolase [Phototrophicus methaneseepsis]|uniref:MBL fold metallo-hydrolase n=1 Tax=Phototrophicus methaneseepsis TaxID=2710758 RepID=A0A7S8EDL4_9CHLR|nr:MBL fold metallo-hydrolase [Phototrophicus methaneseepsis]QPC84788.1 MBL fold metallo-hydrolase [Phototrophicus methaneseepsis]
MTTQTLPAVEHFRSSTGVEIYRIPAEAFPGFWAYAYLLIGAGVPTLVDTGSGYPASTEGILAGLASVTADFDPAFRLQDIARIIITHGHVDHFGGLVDLLEAVGGADVGIHPLDRRVLTNYDERVIVATRNLTIYLKSAGIQGEALTALLQSYGFSKQHIRSSKVDFVVEDGDEIDGMQFVHVPGHCSGQVAIRLGDVLLSADHVLSYTAPNVAAESITHYTGLGHYRDSLRKVQALDGIRLAMGGHEDPIEHFYERIDRIQARIDQKLGRILTIIRNSEAPMSITDICDVLYATKQGFERLLALQQTGAYTEYLYDRGHLSVANLQAIEQSEQATVLYNVL